jgi:hypothetical protein
MRTTITLDPDVKHLLQAEVERSGQSFKVTVNQAIRRALAGSTPSVQEAPFVVTPQSMGMRAGLDAARLQQLADELEVDSFTELTRQLAASSKAAT